MILYLTIHEHLMKIIKSAADLHFKSRTESASMVGSPATGSRAPVIVTTLPTFIPLREPFLPSLSMKRVPKVRDSKWLRSVRTVHVKSAEPHAVLTVIVLPCNETTLALRKSTSPLFAICISSGHRGVLPSGGAAGATPSAAARCGGNEKRNAKSESAKKAPPATTAVDLYRSKSMNTLY